jgi:hypothetical protein
MTTVAAASELRRKAMTDRSPRSSRAEGALVSMAERYRGSFADEEVVPVAGIDRLR